MTLLRCGNNSTQRYHSRLPINFNEATFQPTLGADRFSQRTLVEAQTSQFGTWTLQGRAEGKPGSITAKLNEEPLTLSGGRFNFDDLVDVAVGQDGKLDTLSRAAGWQRSDDLQPKSIGKLLR